ncbi:hypothetical protein [Staphylococcus shinii]|uniref:hypothetical protein n=1 Tax=Staphylococcus shinii TaxID=2912228 RepID=UPI0035110B52
MEKSLLDRVKAVVTKEKLIEAFERHGVKYSLNENVFVKKNLNNTIITNNEHNESIKGFQNKQSKHYNIKIGNGVHKKKVKSSEQNYYSYRELVA